MNAVADAIEMATKALPPPTAPRHALSLGSRSRPLRPEDFGALPTGRRG